MNKFTTMIIAGVALSLSAVSYADPATIGQAPQFNQNQTQTSMQKPKSMQKALKKTMRSMVNDMSSEQKQKIKQIVKGMRPEIKQIAQQFREGRVQMKTYIMSPTLDEATVKNYTDNQGRLYARMMLLRIQMRQKIYQLMTPEQRQRLQKGMEQQQLMMMKNRMQQ